MADEDGHNKHGGHQHGVEIGANTDQRRLGVALAVIGAFNVAFDWWWAEYVAAAGLLFWLVRETREAVEAAREGSVRCCDE